MMKLKCAATFTLCLLAATAIGGCQSIAEKRKIDYGNTRTLPPLDVPPDLSELPSAERPGETTSYSAYSADQSRRSRQSAATDAVLPEYRDVKIARDGRQRWLIVNAEPEVVWPRVRESLLSNGLLIAKENPLTGVIDTEWAENRALVGTGSQKLLAKWLASFYSTGTRDKYRIRLERGIAPGTTEVYLAHQGMQEVISRTGVDDGVEATMWQPRPSDPELEVEILRLLMVGLGADEQQAATQTAKSLEQPIQDEPQAALRRNGQDQLLLSLQDSLDRAWRRVGLSLDRIGFTVEDRNRSNGVYYVRYIDPDVVEKKKGFFARLFSGKEKPQNRDQYQIRLESSAVGTDVDVLTQDGTPETSKTGERILSLLYEQLK